jgi:hypothetical protein
MKLLGIILRYREESANVSMFGNVLTRSQDDLEQNNTHRHGFRHLTLRGDIRRRSLFASGEHSGRVATARNNKR